MIRAVHVCKTIRGARVLDDVSLDLEPGRITALVGPNGSGKTMLMRVFAGFVAPTSGHVEVDGVRLGPNLNFPPSMGLLLEGPALLDQLSGYENLRTLASIRGIADERQIRGWLARVGLDPDDRRRYRAYSLGMRQRLGIACACMEEPDFLILDEPTNALDADGVAMVQRELRAARGRGATVLMACHDALVVRAVADEIWHIAEGHLEGHEVFEARGGDGNGQAVVIKA